MLTDIKLTQVKAASEIDEIILSATQFKPATPQAKNLFESMPPSYSAESLQDHRLHPHREEVFLPSRLGHFLPQFEHFKNSVGVRSTGFQVDVEVFVSHCGTTTHL